jgi:hypothetical protein
VESEGVYDKADDTIKRLGKLSKRLGKKLT